MMFLKASLHGVKRKRRSPPIWKHNVFVTRFAGSISFAGKMILEAILHRLTKSVGIGVDETPHLQAECL